VVGAHTLLGDPARYVLRQKKSGLGMPPSTALELSNEPFPIH
jgi:hypothetical protein